MAYIGLWPIVGVPSGGEPIQVGASSGGATVTGQPLQAHAGAARSPSSVTGVSATTHVQAGAALSLSWVEGVDLGSLGGWPSYRLWFSAQAMAAYVGSSASVATVTGAYAATIVREGHAFAGAQVTGKNNAAGGEPGFVGYLPFFALQGSTLPVPWGLSSGGASVTGQGVYSVLGDYSTPPRSVFDIPPPADFKQPGLTWDYGLAPSMRPAGAVAGDLASYSGATGQLRAVVIVGGAALAQAAVTGQVRAAIVVSGTATAGATVTGVALGVITTVASGAASSEAHVEGQDRSLTPGAALGIAAAYSSATGDKQSTHVNSGAAFSAGSAQAVDASGYPLAAPAGSSSSRASVTGEAIATIVRECQAEALAVIAGVQATLAIAEAASSSMAAVGGVNAALTTVVPAGRWPSATRGVRGLNTARPGTGNTRRPANTS